LKKTRDIKDYIAVCAVILLFILVSFTSLSSIRMLQGNARVVNYVGIVRGATQKLIKEEIMGWHQSQTDPSFAETSEWYPNNTLVNRLNSIVDELLTGEGTNGLVVLQDEEYLSNLRMVLAHWIELKELIEEVRNGEQPDSLFESSQAYFELVNETVFSAEAYSEKQVNRIYAILIIVNGLFILLIASGLVFYWRSHAAKRRADALGRIAYVDLLTKMDNRASCERLIERFRVSPGDSDIIVFMFDMNDLKLINDFLGHQGGDKVITSFGNILKDAAKEYGFIGRYGGDEFLAIFEKGDEAVAETFLRNVRERVDGYNENQVNNLEKIRYAAGYVIATPSSQDIDDIIHEADNQMYLDKRRLKGIL